MDFSHIRTIKKPEENQQPTTHQQAFIRNTSFAIETDATLQQLSQTELTGISTLAGNLQGGTFAQRARAAELQAARSRTELKSKNPQASPSPPPRRLLTLKMPRRQKWTPLDLAAISPDGLSVMPENDSNAIVSGQASKEEKVVVNEEPNKEPNQTYEAGQVTSNNNHKSHAELFSAYLYGSRATSTLQSHDLSEYPAELGARIESEMPPRLKDSFQSFPSQQADSGRPTAGQAYRPSDQSPLHGNQRIVEQQQQHHQFHERSNHPQQSQSGLFFDPLSLEQMEQELAESFDRVRGNQVPQLIPQIRPDSYGGGHNILSDPKELLGSENFRRAYRQSHAAVRGTPAADLNSARLASVNLPPHNMHQTQVQDQHLSTSQNRGYPRRASEQEREILQRQLNNLVLENSTKQTHRGPQAGQSHQILQPNQNTQTYQSYHSQQPNQSRYGVSSDQWCNTAGELMLPPLNQDSQALPWNEHPTTGMFTRDTHSLNQNPAFPHRTGIWRPDKDYHGERRDGTKREPSAKEKREANEAEVDQWWKSDNRVAIREKRVVEEFIRAEAAMNKVRTGRYLRGEGPPHPYSKGAKEEKVKEEEANDPFAPYNNEDMVNDLLIPAVATLASYKTDHTNFYPFSKPPSWAIDHTPGGNESFFSRQWGTPPQRVGRDPRYRAMQHDGRSSVFEDPTGRFPREEFSHDRGRWGPH